jgi:hypothetical protein
MPARFLARAAASRKSCFERGGRAADVFFLRAGVFARAVFRRAVEARLLPLRADARAPAERLLERPEAARLLDRVRLRPWLARFREDAPALRRADFFAMVLDPCLICASDGRFDHDTH